MTLEEILAKLKELDQTARGVGPHTIEMVIDHRTASEIWAFLRELKARRDDEGEKKDKKDDARKRQQRYGEEAFKWEEVFGSNPDNRSSTYRPGSQRAPPPNWESPFGAGLGSMPDPDLEEQIRRAWQQQRDSRFRAYSYEQTRTKQEEEEFMRKMNEELLRRAQEEFRRQQQRTEEDTFYGRNKARGHSPSKKPWYEVLGIDPQRADRATIKSAWRKLAKIHHPDRGGSTEAMADINRAKDEGLSRC